MNAVLTGLSLVASFVGMAICIALAVRNLVGDPARGRRRCPRCWHELGPVGLLCAECGFTARKESATLKSRRNLRLGLGALVVLVLLVVTTQSRLLNQSVWSFAPTRALILATPYFAGAHFESCAWELGKRISSGDASDNELHDALALAIAGDSDALPSSEEWRAKYVGIIRAVTARLAPDDPALMELLTIAPRIDASVLEGDGSAPLLVLDAGVWWPDLLEGRAELRFADGSIKRARFEPSSSYPAWNVALAATQRAGPCTLTLSYRVRGALDEFTTLAPIAVEVPSTPIALVPPLTPAHSTSLDEAIRAVFVEGLIVWQAGQPRAGLQLNSSATSGEAFESTAIGLVVELCENGIARRTSRLWWRGGSDPTHPRWLPSIEDEAALARLFANDPKDDGAWTLRVRGDAPLAAYAIDPTEVASLTAPIPCTKFFDGNLEIPVTITRVGARSHPRRWLELAVDDRD